VLYWNQALGMVDGATTCVRRTEAALVEQRSVTLILRLVLDARGRLQYGEAVDTEAQSQGRFVGWDGLTRTVRAWLARQEHDSGADG
jgi:hypothetical protein